MSNPITSKVIILSRTKMSGINVCVGAFDIANNRMLRLLNNNAGALTQDCPFHIGETYTIKYETRYRICPPHTEDVAVYEFVQMQEIDGFDLASVTSSLSSTHLTLDTIFDGKLIWENQKGYVSENNITDYSVTITSLGYDLTKDLDCYVHRHWGLVQKSIKYVGSLDITSMPQTITAGTKIRFSLARLWDMRKDGNRRAYLQLSGVYP